MSNSTITTINTSSNHHHHQQQQQHHHHHHHHHSRISNGTQACAACKYQRRKCAQDCVLAPYFPHDRQRQFLNAHRLFGVSNICKIIRNLKPPDKDIAMRTIIYQSDARAKDPVGGCYMIIKELQHQIAYCKAELDLVLQQLQLCKAQVYQQQQQHQLFQLANDPNVEVVGTPPIGDHGNNNQGAELVITTCDHNNNNNNNNNNDNDNFHQYQAALMRCYYYDEVVDQGNNNNNNNNEHHYMPNNVPQQQHCQDPNDQYAWVAPLNEDAAVLASSNSSTSHGECFVIKNDFGSECEGLDMKQQIQINVDGVGVGVPYDEEEEEEEEREYGSKFVDLSCCDLQGAGLKFDPQRPTELSNEVTLKEEKIVLGNPEDESFHHISEQDLRNAATLFTLTS